MSAEDKLEDFGKRIAELEAKLLNGGQGLSDDFIKRLEKVEKKSKKAKDMSKKCEKKLKKWKPKWMEMEKDIEFLKASLNNKLDRSIFDVEIERLKDLIN